MGNTSSAPAVPISPLIHFDKLPVEEQNDLRQQIVREIRKEYNVRVEQNRQYVPIPVKECKDRAKSKLYVTEDDLYKMCKEAIPVPFVIDWYNRRELEFWVVLVENPTVSSTE
jgi:hypothetical protein